ncbi:MAG: peptidoglycan domain protein, partial [Deltaproteobacteria bacterium]|nr:peptidoglycan domain protein [Deltaproteobacteria bacterium]
VGRCTLQAVNRSDPKKLHRKIFEDRLRFIRRIIELDPSQRRFERGWINRMNDFKFQ